MSNINVIASGNGTAYCIPAVVYNTGESIELYANPSLGATLDDIVMYEQHGWSVAVSVTTYQVITYDQSWGDCTIYVTFSGGSPPPPPPTPFLNWLIPIIKKRIDTRRKS